MDQAEKASRFRALHERGEPFLIPNPWDVGSACILERLGFEALATTSGGHAMSVARLDHRVTREQTLEHCRALSSAATVPVSADLGKGFGESPESAAETVRAAAETGLAGCSIEDHPGPFDAELYGFDLAVHRIEATAEAARSLPHDFMLTARCESFAIGKSDLDDTIKRLQAFEAAGADVLHAPGLVDIEMIRTVCASLTKPVNVLIGFRGMELGLHELAAVGVQRVSVGAQLARIAYGAFLRAAEELLENGRIVETDAAVRSRELMGYFADREQD